jgi:hypothetical protein
MSLVVYDRIQQTGSANTTVSFTLSATTAGYQSFAVVGNGNTTYYSANDGTNWEVGIGTYSTTGPTLTRTTILSSSNSNAAVSTFGASVTIFCDYPAGRAVTTDIGNAVSANTATNLASGSTYAFPYQSGVGNTTFLSPGTTGSVLITTGTFGPPTWLAQSSMAVGTTTNIAGGAAGEIPFQTGSGATSFSAVGTAGQVLTSQGTGTPTWTTPTTGTVTSVTGTSPIASTGGATPTISIGQATTSTNGYLSSTDWNTFNGKAPATTYTTNYVPYGQGTTTPNQSSNFTFDGTTQLAPIQGASNGININSRTISASYSIPAGYSASSTGPITINSGVVVTVPTGSKWVIL